VASRPGVSDSLDESTPAVAIPGNLLPGLRQMYIQAKSAEESGEFICSLSVSKIVTRLDIVLEITQNNQTSLCRADVYDQG
jgi:hypothetical protein